MNNFDKDALEVSKIAVFQKLPFLFIIADKTKLRVTFQGREDVIVEALKTAMDKDKDLARIINRAMQRKDESVFLQKNRELQIIES